MNRKKLWGIALITIVLFMFAMAGCGSDAPATETSQETEELYFQIDAYVMAGGMLHVTYDDATVEETGSYSLMGYPGDTVGDALTAAGISGIEPVLEGDTFEGWMIFENVLTVEEDGWETYTSELRSGDRIYTTEELLEIPIPEYDASFVAKWAGIPTESYFADEDYMWEAGDTTGSVVLLGNGGQLFFQLSDGSDSYDCMNYTYWLEDGQTLNEIMSTDEWDSFVEARKEGSHFSGWTVYGADSVSWSSEPVNEGSTISLPFDVYEGFEYIVLENAAEYSSSLSTEELCALLVEGNAYVAVANWEAD